MGTSAVYRVRSAAIVTSLFAATVFVLAGHPAGALTVYDVTSLTDGTAGSLRDLITSANGDGDDSEINLPADADIVLDVCGAAVEENANAAGDLDVTAAEPLTINGNGSTITQTCASQRVLHVVGAADVQLWELTITGGDVTVGTGGGNGAGVYLENNDGSLLIALSSIVENTAANVGGGIAAPLGDARTLSIFDSTISGNTAEAGGGVWGGSALIVNSTISGNSIVGFGSGGAIRGGQPELLYVTITGNDAGSDTLPGQIGSETRMWGSVIGAASDGGRNCAPSITVTSGGYNVEEGNDCGLSDGTDLFDTDPVLGPLANNGGPTLTHLPGASSPLLDNIPVGSCDFDYVADQRNVARPQGPGCDTGSVEVQVDETIPPGETPPDETPPAGTNVATNPRFTG